MEKSFLINYFSSEVYKTREIHDHFRWDTIPRDTGDWR